MSAWGIRWKLTAWYIIAMAMILLIFGGLTCFMMNRQLHQQIDAQLVEEAKELAEEIADLKSIDEIQTRFDRHYAEHGGFSFQVTRADGTVICGSPWLRAHPSFFQTSIKTPVRGRLQDVSLANSGRHRIYVREIHASAEPLLIQVLVPYMQTQRVFYGFVKILIASGGIALLIACVGGLSIARRALQPLQRLSNAAERISTENLAMSIDVDNPDDELGRLAITLNRTFQRLHDSVERIQRFTADAAHELRTPLSVLRTRLEVALRSPNDVDQMRNSAEIALEQTTRLTSLIDQLLLLSRQDVGIQKSLFEDVDLKSLLQDVVELLQPAASMRHVTVTVGQIPECLVIGDDISLSRLFYNLVHNAIKFTPPDGHVRLTACRDDERVQLSITDSGIGIAANHLPRVFDRFYRVDPSRNGQTGGTGLGLAICKSIVQAHGGEIAVSSTWGEGTTFTVKLPRSGASAVCEPLEEPQHV